MAANARDGGGFLRRSQCHSFLDNKITSVTQLVWTHFQGEPGATLFWGRGENIQGKGHWLKAKVLRCPINMEWHFRITGLSDIPQVGNVGSWNSQRRWGFG